MIVFVVCCSRSNLIISSREGIKVITYFCDFWNKEIVELFCQFFFVPSSIISEQRNRTSVSYHNLSQSIRPEQYCARTIDPLSCVCCFVRGYMALSRCVWTDRLIVNAQSQKQVIYINILQYLRTPPLVISLTQITYVLNGTTIVDIRLQNSRN